MATDEDFGNRLRRFRIEANLTQRQLAKLAGAANSSIQNYEAGRVPTQGRLQALADAVGRGVEELLPSAGHDANPALEAYLDSNAGLELPGWLRKTLRKMRFPERKELTAEFYSDLAEQVLGLYDSAD